MRRIRRGAKSQKRRWKADTGKQFGENDSEEQTAKCRGRRRETVKQS